MFLFLHRIVGRPADSLSDREDKVRIFFANVFVMCVLGVTEIALVIDSTEQGSWGFLASVLALCAVAVIASLGLQFTLKSLFPAWSLTAVAFMIGMWWAAAAFGILAQGSMFAIMAIQTPWFTFAVAQNQPAALYRRWFLGLQAVSIGGLVAAVVVHSQALISEVALSQIQFWVVLGFLMIGAMVMAFLTTQQLIARAAEAEYVRDCQRVLEERLAVAMELVREPASALVQLASTEAPPHPASVVASNLILQAVNDLEGVVGYNVSHVTFTTAELRPMLKQAVSEVDRYVKEMREAAAVSSSAAAVKYRNGTGEYGVASQKPPIDFALLVHDAVPVTVRTDDRRLTDIVQECVYNASLRAVYQVKVVVSFQAAGTWLEIRVVDDGLALSGLERKRVFTATDDDDSGGTQKKGAAVHGAGRRRMTNIRPALEDRLADGLGFLERRGFLQVPLSGMARIKRIVPLLSASLNFEHAAPAPVVKRAEGGDASPGGAARGGAFLRRTNSPLTDVSKTTPRRGSDGSVLDPNLRGSTFEGRPRGGGPVQATERGNTLLLRVQLSEPEVPAAIDAGIVRKADRLAAFGNLGQNDTGDDAAEVRSRLGLSGFRSELDRLAPADLVRSAAEVTHPSWFTSPRHTEAIPHAERTVDAVARYFALDDADDERDTGRSDMSPARRIGEPVRRNSGGGPQERSPVPASPTRWQADAAAPQLDTSIPPSHGDPRQRASPDVSPTNVPASGAAATGASWPWLRSDSRRAASTTNGGGGDGGQWWPPPPITLADTPRMQDVDPMRLAQRAARMANENHTTMFAPGVAQPRAPGSGFAISRQYRPPTAFDPTADETAFDVAAEINARSSAQRTQVGPPLNRVGYGAALATRGGAVAPDRPLAAEVHFPIPIPPIDETRAVRSTRVWSGDEMIAPSAYPALGLRPPRGLEGGVATPGSLPQPQRPGDAPNESVAVARASDFDGGMLPPRYYGGSINGGAVGGRSSAAADVTTPGFKTVDRFGAPIDPDL